MFEKFLNNKYEVLDENTPLLNSVEIPGLIPDFEVQINCL